ncbi:hypothetical protein ACTID9_21790 [Brevibacillus fluminis]|uniref:hypothetical protein n=1 Tax=Brevibacillus fluminis TaxID=511487 RepID=UPI003F8B240D
MKNQIESSNSNEVALTPQDQGGPIDPPTGNKALLVITLTTGERKEFDLTMSQVSDFINWYEGSGTNAYVFVKDYIKGPFTSRKDYVARNQIVSFEVNEY